MDRRNNFDFLRLFAAALVIVGHGFALMGRKPPMFIGAPISALGVAIFFTISGYLISASWDRDPHLFRFFMKRSLRLFPALATVAILTAFLLGPIATSLPQSVYWTHPATYEYLMNIGLHVQYFLPGLFVHNPISGAVNGSLWSLPVEFSCYLIVPLVALLSNRNRLYAYFFLSSLFAMGAVYLLAYHYKQIVIYATDARSAIEVMAYFCCGAAYWILRDRVRYTIKGIALSAAIIFSLSIINRVWLVAHVPGTAVATIVIAYSILAIADRSVIRLPNAARFGDISYGTYLFAFPIQQVIAQKSLGNLGVASGIVVALSIVLPFAFVSWHLVEKRALAMKPSRASLNNEGAIDLLTSVPVESAMSQN